MSAKTSVSRAIDHCWLSIAYLFTLTLGALSAAAVCAAERDAPNVSPRLEQVERRLAETQAQLDALLASEVQRQAWEQSIARRLPAVNDEATNSDTLYIPTSNYSVHDASAADVPMELEAELKKLGGAVQELGAGMTEMKSGIEELASNLRITTVDPGIKIGVFGWLRGEMVLSSARPVLSGAPFFLSPDAGLDQDTVDVHGKSTGIGAGIQGPCICGYESGGLILIYFFGDTVLANTSGVFLAQAYGELKNDEERYAFGVQADIFNPRSPTMVNWALLGAAGNAGYLRGQLRYERYIKPSDTVQWTLIGGVSNPAPTSFLVLQDDALLTESNGWPNVEGRVSLGLGCEYQDGLEKRQPFEVGLSGVIGQVRSTLIDVAAPPPTRVVADVWGVGCDLRYAVTDRWGLQGEFYKGRGLGTYAATIATIINPVTRDTINSHGAWGEVYYYFNPCLHTHWGAAFDDVDAADVAIGQRTYNQAIFANLMWDVTHNFQVAFEVSHWETDYRSAAPTVFFGDNEGMVYHFRMQYSF